MDDELMECQREKAKLEKDLTICQQEIRRLRQVIRNCELENRGLEDFVKAMMWIGNVSDEVICNLQRILDYMKNPDRE